MAPFSMDEWVKYTQGNLSSSFHSIQHFNSKETFCWLSLVVRGFEHMISADLEKINIKNSYSFTQLLNSDIKILTSKCMEIVKIHPA